MDVTEDEGSLLPSSSSSRSETPNDPGYGTGKDSDTSAVEDTRVHVSSEQFSMDVNGDYDYESDCTSVTDDGYLAGDEETRTILWRHVEFYVVRNPVPGSRHILAAIVTLLHTKGESRKPRLLVYSSLNWLQILIQE